MAIGHARTWRIGDVEIVRVVEVEPIISAPDWYLPGLTADDVLAHPWLIPHFATPDGQLLMAFQAFAVRTPDRRIMVDTCLGGDRDSAMPEFSYLGSRFLDELEAAGFHPHDVDAVVCTHLHFDHVGWNTRLVDGRWEPTFPHARHLFCQREWEHSEAVRQNPQGRDVRHLAQAVDPIVAAGLADFVATDHRICDEVWLEPTPGHTPGHVAVHIASRGHAAVITGDMMHHPILIPLTGQQVMFDHDKELGARTRAAFVERYADTGTRVIGTHFTGPTSGRIRRDGDSYKLVVDPD